MHDRPHQLTAARILITPPSADVFLRDDVRKHLRVDFDDDDTLIEASSPLRTMRVCVQGKISQSQTPSRCTKPRFASANHTLHTKALKLVSGSRLNRNGYKSRPG